jgi:hypothetical protein
MGCDPSVMIVFGINLGHEEELDEEHGWINDERDEKLYELFKGPDDPAAPTVEYPDLRQGRFPTPDRAATPEEQKIIDSYSAYWDAQRRIGKNVSVDFQSTGADGSSGNVIYISESYAQAEWSDSIDVVEHMDKFSGLGEWRERLSRFCERTGLPFSEPRWLAITRYA